MRALQYMLVVATLAAPAVQAAEKLKPFILADQVGGDLAAVSAEVGKKVAAAGFEVVGEYEPYDGVRIIGVTSDILRGEAAKSKFGAYGAVQRIALTRAGDKVQVSYTDPQYMSHAYRMKGDLSAVAEAMHKALGAQQSFGPDEGLAAEDLREYHYMFGMPYFDDPLELAVHDSYEAAVKAVEEKLAAGTAGVTKVWRVDIPGQDETLFGVGMKVPEGGNKNMDDRYIMSEIDFKEMRSSAHLPYEIVVSGNRAYALPAEFRIAINFPDLSMMGANSFMNIMQSPDAIRTALTAAAGGGAKSAGFGF